MKKRVNITLDEDLIPLVQNHAKLHDTNMSEMIEKLLKREIIVRKSFTKMMKEYYEKHPGMINATPPSTDYNEVLLEALNDKYGR